MMDEVSTLNDYWIGSNGATLSFTLPPHGMSADQALRAAAWLVVMAQSLPGKPEHTFEEYLEAIRST